MRREPAAEYRLSPPAQAITAPATRSTCPSMTDDDWTPPMPTRIMAGCNAPVAQLDRALPSGGRGQGFESLRARHLPLHPATPGSDQANPLKNQKMMAISARNFALDAHFSPRKRLAKGGSAARPARASLRRTSSPYTPIFRQEKVPLTPFQGRNMGVFPSQSTRYLGPTPAEPLQ